MLHITLMNIQFLHRVFPQIALAIGVLTSNRRGGDEPLWQIGRGIQGAIAGRHGEVPLPGAIAGCHCRCYGGWSGDDQLLADWTWCHHKAPLPGAIAGCHCWVPLLGAIVSAMVGRGG